MKVAHSDYPLVIFANGLGDHFMTLPALRALNLLFPNKLQLITSKNSFTPYLFGDVKFKKIYEVEFWDEASGDRRFLLPAFPKNFRCDLLIHLCPWNSPDIQSLLSILRVKNSVGMYQCFSNRIEWDESIHFSELIFKIPQWIDPCLRIEKFLFAPCFHLNGKPLEKTVKKKLRFLGDTVVIHNETQPERMLGLTQLKQLVERIRKNFPSMRIMLLSQKPIDLEIKHQNISQVHGLPFPVACAIVLFSDFYIGVDSSFTHLVNLTNKPAIALFGPTQGAHIGFHQRPHQVNLQSRDNTMNQHTAVNIFRAFKKVVTASLADGTIGNRNYK